MKFDIVLSLLEERLAKDAKKLDKAIKDNTFPSTRNILERNVDVLSKAIDVLREAEDNDD